MKTKISLKVAEEAINILENVVNGKKTRTVWECQTPYDQRKLSVYRSDLLKASGYLSYFCMPEKFRAEIERIWEKTHEDYWTSIPTIQPATKIITGQHPKTNQIRSTPSKNISWRM